MQKRVLGVVLNLVQNHLRAVTVEDKEKLDQAKVFLQFNKRALNVVEKENKLLIPVMDAMG